MKEWRVKTDSQVVLVEPVEAPVRPVTDPAPAAASIRPVDAPVRPVEPEGPPDFASSTPMVCDNDLASVHETVDEE